MPPPAAPLATASPVATAAATAVSRSHGPGTVTLEMTHLLEPPSDVAQWPRARNVRERLLEVFGRRRRGRVPLERVREPRVVARPLAAPPRDEDVDEEQQHAKAHDS